MTTQRSGADDRAALAGLVPVPAERDLPAERQVSIREHLISEFRTSSEAAIIGPPTRKDRRPLALRQPRVAAIAALIVVAAVTGIIIAAAGTTPSSTPPSSGACLAPANGDDPFHGGHRTTIAGAGSAVGYPVPSAHTAIANRRTLSQVWASDGLVALEYHGQKITILLMPWPVTQSPARWFRYERRIMMRHYVALGRVNGTPALIVLKADIDACRANPALVEFARRGLDITVRSWSYPAATLLKIADSVR